MISEKTNEHEKVKDLRIELRFKNALLFNALLAHFPRTTKAYYGPLDTQKAAKTLKIGYQTLLDLLSLRASPYRKDGSQTDPSRQLASYLSIDHELLFPPHLYQLHIPQGLALEYSTGEFLPMNRALYLPAPHDEKRQEQQQLIDEVLSTLTPREQDIIRRRYGLEGDEASYGQIGKEWAVSIARISQIHWKAIRKLRHPSRSDKLLKVL
jgi:RNA polymerase sigma factor (sigma-70 family)